MLPERTHSSLVRYHPVTSESSEPNALLNGSSRSGVYPSVRSAVGSVNDER
jgi:hypothetical protein